MGMRWRLIAPLLPGRSDDSVRNRWKRLKEEADAAAERTRRANGGGGSRVGLNDGESDESFDGSSAAPRPAKRAAPSLPLPAPAPKRAAPTRPPAPKKEPASKAVGRDDDGDDESGPRVSWSSYEDQVIVRAVQELGPRWCAVAARLPQRTDQAVRNRWNRLQQRARVQARTMLNAFQGPGGGASAMSLKPEGN